MVRATTGEGNDGRDRDRLTVDDPPGSTSTADPPESGGTAGGAAAPASPASGGSGLVAYVEAVASGAPTPGGGSVVAVVAALAAALGEMVCNLTHGKASDETAANDLASAAARLADLRRDLLRAAADDEAAYARYRVAAALPKGTEDERTARLTALQTALVDAADAPLAVAAACANLLGVLAPVARLGNRHALSDVEAGALLAEAALRGALLNVRGNARLLRDPVLTERYRRRAHDLEAEGRAATERVRAAVRGREGG